MHKDNFPRWDGHSKGYYEVWYLKFNLPDNSASLWIRFTTLSRSDGSKSIAETWAIFTDRSGMKKIGMKSTNPSTTFTFSSDGRISTKEGHFDKGSTEGELSQPDGQSIAWSLKYIPNDSTFFHAPPFLATIGIAKSQVCKPNVNTHFSGWIQINDRRYDFENAAGCQGHIWGTRYAQRWAWGHCNLFSDPSGKRLPGAALEILSAQVKIGGLFMSPLMSALYFRTPEGKEYKWNSLKQVLSFKSEFSLTHWVLFGEVAGTKIQIKLNASPETMAGVQYEATDGAFLYCHNTSFANATVTLTERLAEPRQFLSTLTTAFETVERTHDQSVPLIL